jgi:FlaA1/EpsC-like NDP-sugar epimerase
MENGLKNRREFLKEVSVFAGASALTSSVSWMKAFAGENGRNIAPSDRVRIGIVGVGSRGKALMLNLQAVENVEITAVCDDYEPNYQQAIQLTGGKANAFYDYRKMLEMKDIVINALRIKRELRILLINMSIAFTLNIYSIIKYKTEWIEILSQLHIVIILGLLIYVFSSLIYSWIKILIKRFGRE